MVGRSRSHVGEPQQWVVDLSYAASYSAIYIHSATHCCNFLAAENPLKLIDIICITMIATFEMVLIHGKSSVDVCLSKYDDSDQQ